MGDNLWYYVFDDCQMCNGTGHWDGGDCPGCIGRYVQYLERVICDCVSMKDMIAFDYDENVVVHAVKKHFEYERGRDNEAAQYYICSTCGQRLPIGTLCTKCYRIPDEQ